MTMLWVTKYALTTGIQYVGCDIEERYAYSRDQYRTQYGPGDWHRTEAGAVGRAEKMRTERIAALKRQIGKLTSKRFTVGKP